MIKTRLIMITATMITTITMITTSCTPSDSTTIGGYPICNTPWGTQPSNATTCVQPTSNDHGTGSGWLVEPSGAVTPINFWANGETEFPS